MLFFSLYGQNKSEREQRDYFGVVKTVRIEIVEYSFEDGKLKAGKRELDSTEQFDRFGKLLEEVNYDSGREILWSEKNVFSNGRLIETVVKHSPFLHLSDKRIYKYDDAGNLIEENGYDLSGKLLNQSIYVYDGQNQKIQWTSMSYHPEERSKPHRYIYSYDERGRLQEEKTFSDEGNGFVPTDSLGRPHKRVLIYKNLDKWKTASYFNTSGAFVKMTTLSYDSKGNEIEDIEYDQNENVKEKIRYEYEFDKLGNWIVEKTYRWNTEYGKSSYQLEEIDYRTIKYFKN
ncbi:MAG: hypothetical protein ABI891_12185 [Acidobacteriota bacterium]